MTTLSERFGTTWWGRLWITALEQLGDDFENRLPRGRTYVRNGSVCHLAIGKGQIDADLGGEVIKQRIARQGRGRSSGYRTIILFRRGMKAFFVYGFPKSHRANIDADELRQFREAAKHVLALTEKQLAELLKRGDFLEVKENGQEIPK